MDLKCTLDLSNEIEMFFRGNGVNVELNFIDGHVVVLNNCTEVHSKYNKSNHIAFESDIHSTGVNYKIDLIQSITIKPSTEITEGF